MTVYLYRNHLGSFYAENRPLSWHECRCSECGGNDYLIGKANTKEEAWNGLEKSGLNRVWYAKKALEAAFNSHGRHT